MGQIYASISKNTQPTCVNKDLRIISKLWVDALDDESDIELQNVDHGDPNKDPYFEIVLAKSQEKKTKEKSKRC